MTLKQLEAFHLAATLGSFALAALRAHVTQSSLSKRVAELEASVGAELFDRSSRRAQLTEAGHRLLPLATQMLALKAGIGSAVSGPSELSGVCRFGISELGALTWLPRFVAVLRAEHPQLVLQPHVDLGRRLEREVVRGELDFAVVPGPPDDPHVVSHVVGDVRFSWMAAPGRIAAGRVFAAKELSEHPVITMTEGSGLTRAFNAWCTEQGLQMRRIVASNSLMAIVGLTMADIGISFLPTDLMKPWVKNRTLVAFRTLPPLPTLKYCYLHRIDDSRAMLGVLRRYVEEVAQFSVPASFAGTRKAADLRRP